MQKSFDEIYRNRAWICLSAAIFATSLAVGCSKKPGGDDEAAVESVAQVTLTTVARGDISRSLLLNGSVAAPPNLDVKVSSLVPGRVAELTVAEGDHVAQGQLLARIEDHTYRDQVTQAEAALAQAQANLDNAKLNFARNQDLVNRGIAARKDLEDSQTQQAVAQAALSQANAALSIAKLQLSRAEVRSPIAGTVVKRSVSVGEQVDGTAAGTIVEVASLGEVELQANVPAADLVRLKTGETVKLTSQAMPGRAYTGRVIAISQAVDPTSNAGLVRIRVPNSSGELRLGMFLAAQVPIETHIKVLIVPAQSIYKDDQGQPRVFQVAGDTATAQPVKLGIETPDRVEITGGASEGEKIILTGGYGLGDKAKVAVQGAPNADSDGAKPDDKGAPKDDKDTRDKKDPQKP